MNKKNTKIAIYVTIFGLALGMSSCEDMLIEEPCCKVCSSGYACGDSCISRNSECHRAPGCACNAR